MKKKFAVLDRVLALCGFVLVNFQTQPAPVTFNTALPVSKGEGLVRVQMKILSATDDPGLMDRALTVKALPLVGVWGVTSRWALFGVVPLLNKTLKSNNQTGSVKRSVNGLGDMTAILRYTAYSKDQLGQTFRFSPFVGIKMPTGKDDSQDKFGQLPATLQLGSGSWDGLIGGVVTAQSLKQEWGVSTTYQINNEANDLERGDEARLNFSYHRRVWMSATADGLPRFLYAGVESNWVWGDRNQMNGLIDSDSGGENHLFCSYASVYYSTFSV